MDNVFVLSNRKQVIESLRHALVYPETYGLSFRFFEDVEALVSEIQMSYMPKCILVDEKMTEHSLPTKLLPISARMVERLKKDGREVLIYQNINGFIDDVAKLINSDLETTKSKASVSKLVWILDLEEGNEGKGFVQELLRSANRSGLHYVGLDLSKWGDVFPENSSLESLRLSNLLEVHSQGGSLELTGKCHNGHLFIVGVDHPIDLHYLNEGFLESMLQQFDEQVNCVFIYSGLLALPAMTYLANHVDCVWSCENHRDSVKSNEQTKKLLKWIQNNNKRVAIEEIGWKENTIDTINQRIRSCL